MKYFTFSELCFSHTALKYHINNEPSAPIVRNLTALVDNVLDPIRVRWGQPLIVTSGYRCPWVNHFVNGMPNSQHLKGQAADIVTQGCDPVENYRLFELIKDSDIPFDQLIAEHCSYGRGTAACQWLHVSYNPQHNRNQVIIH